MRYQTHGTLGVETAQTVQVDERACVICDGETNDVLLHVTDDRFGVPGEYGICRCSACGLEQTLPRPNPDDLKQLYEKYYNFGGERETTYIRLREWFFASWLYRMWLTLDGDGSFHLRRGEGRLLDIGCNEGRGLKIYQQNGFFSEGLELNSRAAEVARSAGFAVHETLLEDFHPATPYDVVVLSNVLEHALDPKRMLLDIARILKPDGQVWIACPNSESWLRRLFGRAWINWHVPFHIVHFSPRTLRRLLLETGFSNVELHQITPALWVASSIITGIFATGGRATRQLRNPLLVLTLLGFVRILMFPFLYIGNRLGRGDCLVAAASVPSTPE
jgi:2-polyprenyl-3-methyl-5-hydroxy-6-metoxy-1,4-benzoquinol methylase